MKYAETSPVPSVSSFLESTYDFLGIDNEIKVVLLSILVLRFLETFPCGFAVFAEILCGFAVSGTPLNTLPHCPDGGAKSHRGAPRRHWGAPWGHRGAPRGIWVHLEVTGVQQSDQKSSGVHPSLTKWLNLIRA